MTTFSNRIFTFLLLVGIFMPTLQTHAVWQQPPQSFAPAIGGGIGMGSDNAGNAIVVLDNGGTVEAFFYSVLTQTWTGPTILGSDSGDVVLSVDPGGTALAVWVDPDFADLHSAFFNGTTWVTGSPDPFVTGENPQILNLDMNGPNTALLTWFNNGPNTIVSNFFSAGTWGPMNTISNPGEFPLSSDYSANGTAVASYLDITETMLLVSNFIGGFWQQLPGFTLDTDMHFTSNNGVAQIDANGHAAVVWVDNTGNVFSSSYLGNPLVGWTPAVQISNTPGNDPFTVSFSMAPGGTGVATWQDGAGTGYSNSYNGTSWGTPQIFVPSAGGLSKVTVNSTGNALVLFVSSSGTLFSESLPLGGVWTAPEFVTNLPGGLAFLIPSLSDDKFAFAAWAVAGEGDTYFASVNVLPPPAPPAPPASINAAFCKDKFAMQTDCVTTITWTASPTATVVAYQVFMNGVLVATVPSTGPFVFVKHFNCKTTVYSVVAIDADGEASAPVSITVR
jgi:hypothetical protein